jgi:nitrous oxide reductase accessory protein NosL
MFGFILNMIRDVHHKYLYDKEVFVIKKTLCVMFVLGIFCMLVSANLFASDDVSKHKACPHCGMDRGQFAHSRMLVVFDDGTEVGVCSLHCAAIDLAINIDKTPKTIYVGDFNTKKLIDAEQAFWVIGGNKPGVMTKRAKWAFEKKADAEAFIQKEGGTIANFDQAISASYEDIYADTKMIRERRKMKRMQMEKKS